MCSTLSSNFKVDFASAFIVVYDVNDNSPEFGGAQPYAGTVSELTALNTVIFRYRVLCAVTVCCDRVL